MGQGIERSAPATPADPRIEGEPTRPGGDDQHGSEAPSGAVAVVTDAREPVPAAANGPGQPVRRGRRGRAARDE